MVAGYRLEGNGTDWVSTNNGTVTGASTVAGKQGDALDFDGTDDKIDIPNDASLKFGDGSNDRPFSMSFFVNPDDFDASMSVITTFLPSNAGDYRININGTTGKVQFLLNDSSAGKNPFITSDTGLIAEAWSHVVVTYDGTGGGNCLNDPNGQIYINGVKDGSTFSDDGGTYVAMESGPNDIDIANDNGGSFFDGTIDEVIIFKTELNAEDVKRVSLGLHPLVSG